jgi:hypothetical protein
VKSISGFLNLHRELLDSATYTVQSSGHPAAFEGFVSWLRNESKVSVTPSNVIFLSQLANEFGLDDLRSECASFSRFGDRVAKLERLVASSLAFGRKAEESLLSQERRLESLQSQLCEVQRELSLIRPFCERTKSECQRSIETLKRSLEGRLAAAEVSVHVIRVGSAPVAELDRLRALFGQLQGKVSSIGSLTARLAREVQEVPRTVELAATPTRRPPSRLMQIFVKLPSRKYIALEVDPADRCEDVKGMIQDKTDIPADMFWLTFCGRPLPDKATLEEAGVRKDLTLQCHVSVG